jgi:hypothetical protein
LLLAKAKIMHYVLAVISTLINKISTLLLEIEKTAVLRSTSCKINAYFSVCRKTKLKPLMNSLVSMPLAFRTRSIMSLKS